MEARTNQNICPACSADRLVYGAGVAAGESVEYPVSCGSCGWSGSEWYREGLFYAHTSAAGVVCGYSLT